MILASYLLIAHMVQHELLIMLAPPFILLANPVPVLLWGLGGNPRIAGGPSFQPSHGDTPRPRSLLLDARGLEPLCHQPLGWHYPALYDAALRVPWIHDLEHILFFVTALVFWWPVIQPAYRPAPIQHGLRILYLFFAATQDTILAGLIALSREVLYPHYQTALRLWGLTPQEDQIGGGIVMFAVGSTTDAIAILLLVNALLGEGRRKRSTKRTLSDGAKRLKAASEASSANATQISARTIFSASSIRPYVP